MDPETVADDQVIRLEVDRGNEDGDSDIFDDVEKPLDGLFSFIRHGCYPQVVALIEKDEGLLDAVDEHGNSLLYHHHSYWLNLKS